MSALSELKDKFVADAASVTDDVDRLEALALIDEWFACATASSKLSSKDVISYSIGGQTVTRRDVPQLARRESELKGQIKALLYGGTGGFVDCRFTR